MTDQLPDAPGRYRTGYAPSCRGPAGSKPLNDMRVLRETSGLRHCPRERRWRRPVPIRHPENRTCRRPVNRKSMTTRKRKPSDGLHLYSYRNEGRGRLMVLDRPKVLNALNHGADRGAGRCARRLRRRRRHRRDGRHRQREGVRGRRRHLGNGGQERDGHVHRPPFRGVGAHRGRAQAGHRRPSPATRSGAAASWRWPAISSSRPTTPASGSRRSSSGCRPGSAAPSACHAWPARRRRWISASPRA